MTDKQAAHITLEAIRVGMGLSGPFAGQVTTPPGELLHLMAVCQAQYANVWPDVQALCREASAKIDRGELKPYSDGH